MRPGILRGPAFGLFVGLAAALAGIALAVRGTSDTRAPAPATADGGTPREWVADAALSQETMDRFRGFRAGASGEQLTLLGPQLSALLQHAAPGLVPVGVLTPMVTVHEGRVVVEARVVTAEVSGSSRLSRLVEELADTVDVRVTGSLVQGPGGALYYHVDEARAGRVPLPAQTVLAVLDAMSEGAPDGSIHVPWPTDIGDVSVLADRIVIRRFERIADRAVDGLDG